MNTKEKDVLTQAIASHQRRQKDSIARIKRLITELAPRLTEDELIVTLHGVTTDAIKNKEALDALHYLALAQAQKGETKC